MNHTMETYKNNTSAASGTVLSRIQTTAGTARLRPYGFLFLFLTLLGLFAGVLPAAAEVSGSGTREAPWGVTTWSELCEKMKVEYDAYIRLDNDVIFGTGGGEYQDDALEISSNTNVHIHLNLNGHRIDRNLKNLSAVENGYVIEVSGGTLSLYDDSNEKTGAITGGKNTGNGGGVYVTGEDSNFNMDGGTISGNIANGNNGGGVYVASGGTFNINGGTISDNTAGYGGGVYVSGGSFTMKTGSMISGNTVSVWGGGVYVDGGTFTMNGGTIGGEDTGAGNTAYKGGGVYIQNGSTFTMSGGTISNNGTLDNYGGSNGGGVYVDNSTFTMSGNASISGNTVADDGGGVYVTQSNSTFTLEGGTISDNTASYSGGGVYVWRGNLKMSDGTISRNTAGDGGGVYVYDSTFTMSGGTISNNTISDNGRGGGVYVNEGSFIINSGSTISGNTATLEGGGVYADGCTFTMSGGTIGGTDTGAGNKANQGGGVYVTSSSKTGTFTMEGGTISGNTADNGGGGVYVTKLNYDSTFTIEGGTITQNTASSSGGGVYLNTNGTMEVSGSPVINNNKIGGTANNVYLPNGKTISVTGTLTNAASIAVTMYKPGVFTSGLSGKGKAANFGSDDENYEVILTDQGEAQLNQKGYVITVTSSDYGTVEASAERARENETVTLTLEPDVLSGTSDYYYMPASVTVTGSVSGEKTQITEFGNNEENPNIYTASFTMPPENVTVSASFVTPWAWLQSRLTNAASGSTITLDRDISWTEGDSAPLTFNRSGVDLTLDLAGHTIDRKLTTAAIDGNVLTVSAGSLTLTNSGSGGKITGGKNTGNGGGVYVNGGSFTLSGNAAISDNTTGGKGGGVYVGGGTMEVSGSPVINNNKKGDTPDNVYLCSGNYITVTGPLSESASIGVTLATTHGPGVFTNSADTALNDQARFFSDNTSMSVGKNDAGQLFLYIPVTITGAAVADSKVYDGSTSAVITNYGDLDGVVDGDVVSLATQSAKAEYADKNTGTGKTVTFSGYALSGTDAHKYVLTGQPADTTAEITAKPVSVTVTAENRDYQPNDKTVKITGAEFSEDAIISVNDVKDDVTLDFSKAIGTMEDDSSGTGKTVTVEGITLTGSDAGNYALPNEITTTVTINKADWPEAKKNTSGSAKYGNSGEADLSELIAPGGTAAYDSVTDSDEILDGSPTVSEGKLQFSFKDDAAIVGKTASAVVSVTNAANYKDYSITITLEAAAKDPAALNVTQEGTTYGGTLPDPGPDPAPLEDITPEVSYSGTLRSGSKYGPAAEKPAEAGSYTVSFTYETEDKIYSGKADFTIEPADIGSASVTVGDALTYNGSEQTQTVTAVTLNGTDILADCSISQNTGVNAGDYTLTVTANDVSNYTGTTEQPFTIAKAVLVPNDIETSAAYSAASKTVTLTSVPADAGKFTLTPGAAQTTGSVVFDGADGDADAKTVTLRFSNGTVGDSVTLPVTITSDNYKDAAVNIIMKLEPREDAGVSISEGTSLTVVYGDSLTLHAAAAAEGPNGKWSWTSSDESAADVDENGAVTILKAGVTEITAEYGSDTTVGSAVIRLTIESKKVALPAAISGLKYNGNEQTGVEAGVDFTLTGNTGTEVGSYTATAALKDKVSTVWSDGATGDRTISWSIVQSLFTVTVSTEGNGTATAVPVSGEPGTEITLSAVPGSGWLFREWQVVSGGVTAAENKFTLGTEDVEIKAVFYDTPYTPLPSDEDDPGTTGNDQTYVIGSGQPRKFRIARVEENGNDSAFDRFEKALDRAAASGGEVMGGIRLVIGEKILYPVLHKDYDYSRGSVIITLYPEYLDTLPVGEYTMEAFFLEDNGTVEPFPTHLSVTEPRDMNFINIKNDGSYKTPEDIDAADYSLTILITAGDRILSRAEDVKLEVKPGVKEFPLKEVHFTVLSEDNTLEISAARRIVITGLPKEVPGYGEEVYDAAAGATERPALHKYTLSIREARFSKSGEILVYLLWDDGSRPVEEIRVVALPEDEIGAYQLRPDGTKEYLIFQTYDICMAYLGRDELCRGPERCYHK